MDDHIGERGWDRMSSVDSTGTRVWYEPSAARFVEFGTNGPGAVHSPSRRVLSADEAKRYTPPNVLSGWVPAAYQGAVITRVALDGKCAARRRAARVAGAGAGDARLPHRRLDNGRQTDARNESRAWMGTTPSAILRRARRRPQSRRERQKHEELHRRGALVHSARAVGTRRLRVHRVRPQRREDRRLDTLRGSSHRLSPRTSSVL